MSTNQDYPQEQYQKETNRKYGYLVVEGPHDVEFCCRLLSKYNLNRITKLSPTDASSEPQAKNHQIPDEILDKNLHFLVPTKYPINGDLQKRVPVPIFLQNSQHCIAIHSATGDSQLAKRLIETLNLPQSPSFSSIGIMLDSDKKEKPIIRHKKLLQELSKELSKITLDTKISFPECPGDINHGNITTNQPRQGAYILPDNTECGTLETLLLESAKIHYPELLCKAQNYINTTLAKNLIPKSHRKDISKPAGREKATISVMSSLFKPGKAVQVSIQDNDWLRGAALDLPRIQAVQSFLAELFELTPPAAAAPAQPENAA